MVRYRRNCLALLAPAIAFLVSSGVVVVTQRPAMAQSCTVAPPTGPSNEAALATDERQEIMDLISNYSWAFDEGRDTDFLALFTANAEVAACAGTPPGIVFSANNETALATTVRDQITALNTVSARVRHFTTNTILSKPYRSSDNKRAVHERTMMLVTYKQANAENPIVDYTAVVTGEIVQTGDPSKGEPSAWKFSKRSVVMDRARFVVYAR